jgi:hypothetical protein
MNQYLDTLAYDLKQSIQPILDLPFFTEEEEELFFQLVVAKLAELVLGYCCSIWAMSKPANR